MIASPASVNEAESRHILSRAAATLPDNRRRAPTGARSAGGPTARVRKSPYIEAVNDSVARSIKSIKRLMIGRLQWGATKVGARFCGTLKLDETQGARASPR